MKWPALVPTRQSQPSPVRTTCSTWTRSAPEHKRTSSRADAAVRAIASPHRLPHLNLTVPRARTTRHARGRSNAASAPLRRPMCSTWNASALSTGVEESVGTSARSAGMETRTTHDRHCPGISIGMCTELPACLAPHRTRTLHMERVHQAGSAGQQVGAPIWCLHASRSSSGVPRGTGAAWRMSTGPLVAASPRRTAVCSLLHEQ